MEYCQKYGYLNQTQKENILLGIAKGDYDGLNRNTVRKYLKEQFPIVITEIEDRKNKVVNEIDKFNGGYKDLIKIEMDIPKLSKGNLDQSYLI